MRAPHRKAFGAKRSLDHTGWRDDHGQHFWAGDNVCVMVVYTVACEPTRIRMGCAILEFRMAANPPHRP